jgi:hypothetical protein
MIHQITPGPCAQQQGPTEPVAAARRPATTEQAVRRSGGSSTYSGRSSTYSSALSTYSLPFSPVSLQPGQPSALRPLRRGFRFGPKTGLGSAVSARPSHSGVARPVSACHSRHSGVARDTSAAAAELCLRLGVWQQVPIPSHSDSECGSRIAWFGGPTG